MTVTQINRLKVVLAELNVKNKWLADELGKNQATVSQWCNNVRQPSLETLLEISQALDVDIRQLINPTIDER